MVCVTYHMFTWALGTRLELAMSLTVVPVSEAIFLPRDLQLLLEPNMPWKMRIGGLLLEWEPNTWKDSRKALGRGHN